MRDALGILDHLAAGGTKVNVADANGLLGLIDVKYIFDIADGLLCKDASMVMACIETVVNSGKDDRRLLRDMVDHFRNMLMMKVDAQKLKDLVDYPAFYRKQLFEQAEQLAIDDILKVMDIFIAAKDTERLTDAPRLALELALVKSIVMLSGPVAMRAPVATAPRTFVSPEPLKSPVQSMPKPVSDPISKIAPTPPIKLAATAPSVLTTTATTPSTFSLEDVKVRWDAMTAAVQDKKTYLGSCLLEGAPVSVTGHTLTIAFPKSCEYQKESLEELESMKIVTGCFAAVLGQDLKVVFTVMDGKVTRDNSEALQDALDSFQGEVINEWHNE